MKKTLTALLAVAMVVGIAAPAVAVAEQPATPQLSDDPLAAQETTENETTNETVAPGEMLAGSIGAHQAEIRGEVDRRSFGLQIAAAASNDSKAQVLERVTERLQERQQRLEERNETLEAARQNGTISESQYRVRMTEMAAEAATIRTAANDSERIAAGIPNETLEANGVNVTAIHHLRERAGNMTGPQTAEIARQIAGNHVGAPMGPPENVPGMSGGPMGPGMNESNVTAGPGNTTMGPGDETTMGPANSPGGPSDGPGPNSTMTTDETTTADDNTSAMDGSTASGDA